MGWGEERKSSHLKSSKVNSPHLVLCRQRGDEAVLGDLGSSQNKGKEKGKKLTTKHRKHPKVSHSASSCVDPWCKEAAPTSTVASERLLVNLFCLRSSGLC